MEITIHGRNIRLTERIEAYAEKKTARLDRYMPNLQKITLELSEQNSKSAAERKVAQITAVDKRGTILRAEERSNDIFAAIDSVVDKLYKQIRRYRGKRKKHWRRHDMTEEFLGEPLPDADYDDNEELIGDGAIVRVKQFPLRPMSSEEAIDQIELLGHDFFLFLNVEENNVNVLYRRRDGDYGLLKPQLD